MPPAARISDMHTCPLATPGTPPVPHVGGPVVAGAPTVLVCGVPQARIGDMCTCVGPPDTIVVGSPTVLVSGMPAARLGDNTAHGGVIVTGAPTVLIGGGGSGTAAAGGGPLVLPPLCVQLDLLLAENKAAQDNAMLASAVYGDPDSPLPENTRRATTEDLQKLGLHDGQNDMTKINGSDFRSEVFVRTDPATGEESYVIAFKGTTPTSTEDWGTNVQQGLGQETAYYNQAMEIGVTASDAAPGKVSFTGHSLGGGMASAASAASGSPGTTFNAAGLHPNTAAKYGGSPENTPVKAYYVEGDILSSAQDSTPAADAAGERRPLKPANPDSWTDYAGGAAGGLLGALKGGVAAGAGAALGYEAARGGRLHLMDEVTQSLAAEEQSLREQKAQNGCP